MSQNLWDSFEQILTSVEGDEALRDAERPEETSNVETDGQSHTTDGVGLSAMLSHPELLAKLPLLIRAVQTLSEPTSPPTQERPDTPVELLCALRPYLSEERQRALDTMIRVSKLAQTLRSMR